MITVTEQKPLDEIMQYLEKCKTVYIAGCGTCPTITHTGGKTEVLQMKEDLETAGKKVSGWMVIPTACDIITRDVLREDADAVDAHVIVDPELGNPRRVLLELEGGGGAIETEPQGQGDEERGHGKQEGHRAVPAG